MRKPTRFRTSIIKVHIREDRIIVLPVNILTVVAHRLTVCLDYEPNSDEYELYFYNKFLQSSATFLLGLKEKFKLTQVVLYKA